MGFAGNYEPNYIVPTLISVASEKKAQGAQGGGGVGQQSAADTNIPDLDFFIGEQASTLRIFATDDTTTQGTQQTLNAESEWALERQ